MLLNVEFEKGDPVGSIRFEIDAELGEWEVASDGLYVTSVDVKVMMCCKL